MTEIPEHLKGPPLPEIMRKHPPVPVYAYVHSHPNNQVMGVVIDSRNGYVIEAVILPTKQRVMLGLGIGNENANAHHTYRRRFPHGYKLEWNDNPETDPRLAKLKGRLGEKNDEFRGVDSAVKEPGTDRDPQPSPEAPLPLGTTGQLTAELMQGGVEAARSAIPSRTVVPEQPTPGITDTERGDIPTPKPDAGGFY